MLCIVYSHTLKLSRGMEQKKKEKETTGRMMFISIYQHIVTRMCVYICVFVQLCWNLIEFKWKLNNCIMMVKKILWYSWNYLQLMFIIYNRCECSTYDFHFYFHLALYYHYYDGTMCCVVSYEQYPMESVARGDWLSDAGVQTSSVVDFINGRSTQMSIAALGSEEHQLAT